MNNTINIGDRVKIGEREGEVFKITPLPNGSKEYRIAFDEGPPQSFICPPQVIERLLTPIDRLKRRDFDLPLHFDLLVQAYRLSLAYEYDQLLSLSSSRTNLEYYQVMAVHEVISAYRQRFLIADDVGLGKTIEAGMIFKELAARGRARRVLIIAPAPLTRQWQREMREKFDEYFWRYDSNTIADLKANIGRDRNPWDFRDRIVTSLDYAKRDEVLPALSRTYWHLIIFDEAHKLSWVGPKESKSERYKLAEELYEKTDALLLLTATPHTGIKWQFWKLISFVNPYLFEDEESVNPAKLRSVMIRRGKDGLKDIDGKPIFKKRNVETVPVHFSKEEFDLYESVKDYVKHEYNRAMEEKKRTVGFAMVILQKRMVSSIYAVRKSLEHRLEGLQRLLACFRAKKAEVSELELSAEDRIRLKDFELDPSSLTDDEREVLEVKILSLSSSATEEDILAEIDKVKDLIEKASQIRQDSKGRDLRKSIDTLLTKNPKEKILIFTEYRDTLDYLRNHILADYKTLEIHGNMNMEARVQAEKDFKEGDINIMVATDAAGEGINLQFCHIMINYELPWNPNRIDQRIGRLHRYGQKRDVYVYNLQVENTREGQIFIRLNEKVKTIETQLGGRLSEVLGTLLKDVDLQNVIMRALSEDEKIEVTMKDVEEAMTENLKMWQTVNNNLLMPLRDFDMENAIRVVERSRTLIRENKMTAEDIEQFVRHFVQVHNGKVEKTRYNRIYRIITPKELLGNESVLERYELVTFDKKIAQDKQDDLPGLEFVAFGHPLLDAIVCYCKSRLFSGTVSCKRIDSGQTGVLFNYHLRFTDSKGEPVFEELVPIFIDVKQKYDPSASKKLLNLLYTGYMKVEGSDSELNNLIGRVEELQRVAEEKVNEIGEQKKVDIAEKHNKQSKILMEDLNKYFSRRQTEEEWKIQEYEERMLKGEDMKISIERSKFNLQQLKEEYEKRKAEIESQREVYFPKPELLSVCPMEMSF
ncbi:MAG: helicase-related protein [bacterium]